MKKMIRMYMQFNANLIIPIYRYYHVCRINASFINTKHLCG